MAWRMCNCTDQMNSLSKQSIMVIITIVSNTYSSIENGKLLHWHLLLFEQHSTVYISCGIKRFSTISCH